ncbi:UNVERIFIED_CONTAM: hypothetical protein Sangu_0732900 [Sesamum angustifolium]|uniref:Uncharacterized protein n=1 Tax=Sesamum angustifolium TaxID=2727405 RepID=A0AAW2PRS9_9LAMI
MTVIRNAGALDYSSTRYPTTSGVRPGEGIDRGLGNKGQMSDNKKPEANSQKSIVELVTQKILAHSQTTIVNKQQRK